MAIWFALVPVVLAAASWAKADHEKNRAYKNDHDYQEGHNANHLWNKDKPDTRPDSPDMIDGFFYNSKGDKVFINPNGVIIDGPLGQPVNGFNLGQSDYVAIGIFLLLFLLLKRLFGG